MMIATPIGAIFDKPASWHSINWKKAHRTVNRLQARIVKAAQAGRWNKGKALQRLLTHSFSAKVVAIKRVTENRGKKTPGVDRVVWDSPQKKFAAVDSLKSRGYRPQPLKRIHIPKANNPAKKRPLSIPTMADRAMQALYLQALDPISEMRLDRNAYGFRKGRGCADAIEQCFNVLARKSSAQWILEGDIRSCFDKISHQWLENNLPMDRKILRKWLKSGYIDRETFHATLEGTPQGSIISPAMCNLTLAGMEKQLKAKFSPKLFSPDENPKVNFAGYADDFVVTGASKEILETQARPLIEEFLSERGLELSREKTKIVHIEEGFDFLGQNVRKYGGKLLIKPSRKSVKKLTEKVRTIVKDNKQTKTENLIRTLNPVIRGWANYHRHVVSKKVFASVDHAIHGTLWRWAKRRHPQKSRKWVKEKYFPPMGIRQWNFSAKDDDGKRLSLFRASEVAIQRHTKIKSTANPYDPEDEAYFDRRLGQKWLKGTKGRARLRKLWYAQEGACLICSQHITEEAGWEMHHIQHRVNGGDDKLANLVLLHPNCHRQLHSQGLTVVKPAPKRKRGLNDA